MQFTQGTVFDHFTLVVKGAEIPELHGNVTIKKIVLSRLLPPGDYKENRLKQKPVFLWGGGDTNKPT